MGRLPHKLPPLPPFCPRAGDRPPSWQISDQVSVQRRSMVRLISRKEGKRLVRWPQARWQLGQQLRTVLQLAGLRLRPQMILTCRGFRIRVRKLCWSLSPRRACISLSWPSCMYVPSSGGRHLIYDHESWYMCMSWLPSSAVRAGSDMHVLVFQSHQIIFCSLWCARESTITTAINMEGER